MPYGFNPFSTLVEPVDFDEVATHEAAADPHIQYQKEAEKDAATGYAGLDASSRTTKGIDSTDDLIIDLATKGCVLKSADNHYWRITIQNDGTLITSDLGLVKP